MAEETKTLMVLTKDDKVMKEAKKFCMVVYNKDRNTFNEARDIQSKLDLGGLWRGSYISLMIIIKGMQKSSLATRGKK